MDALTIVLALCLIPIWGTFVWEMVDQLIRPYLISRAEIDGLVDEMLRHPDPEQAAFDRECTASYRGDSFEQGKWRRVRRRLRKRVG